MDGERSYLLRRVDGISPIIRAYSNTSLFPSTVRLRLILAEGMAAELPPENRPAVRTIDGVMPSGLLQPSALIQHISRVVMRGDRQLVTEDERLHRTVIYHDRRRMLRMMPLRSMITPYAIENVPPALRPNLFERIERFQGGGLADVRYLEELPNGYVPAEFAGGNVEIVGGPEAGAFAEHVDIGRLPDGNLERYQVVNEGWWGAGSSQYSAILSAHEELFSRAVSFGDVDKSRFIPG